MQLEVRTYPLVEVRMDTDAEGRPILVGHAAVFDQWSRVIPWGGPRGKFRERVRPGAFTRTLGANPDVKLKVDHAGLPLARTTSRTLTLTPDAVGLGIYAPLEPSDPDVQRIIPKIKRGDLREMSFAFWVPDGGDEWNLSGDVDERSLTEIDLDGGDVSVVADPAYPQTDVALRSCRRFVLAHPSERALPGFPISEEGSYEWVTRQIEEALPKRPDAEFWISRTFPEFCIVREYPRGAGSCRMWALEYSIDGAVVTLGTWTEIEEKTQYVAPSAESVRKSIERWTHYLAAQASRENPEGGTEGQDALDLLRRRLAL